MLKIELLVISETQLLILLKKSILKTKYIPLHSNPLCSLSELKLDIVLMVSMLIYNSTIRLDPIKELLITSPTGSLQASNHIQSLFHKTSIKWSLSKKLFTLTVTNYTRENTQINTNKLLNTQFMDGSNGTPPVNKNQNITFSDWPSMNQITNWMLLFSEIELLC